MNKNHALILAALAVSVAGYFWYSKRALLKKLKGVPGLPAEVAAEVAAANS